MCIIENCTTIPVYNFENEKKALYCKSHKKENMINVINKSCIFDTCNKRPSFNFEGLKNTLYCDTHKKENMININKKYCIIEKCNLRPCFNFENEKKALYCKSHKKENMINIKDEKCIYEECTITPSYNLEGLKKRLYCFQHKLENMVDVKNKPCIFKDCDKNPVYNFSGETKRLYCFQHKLQDMVDVKNKTCKSEWCYTFIKSNKYEDYCLYCYINLFPDKPVSKNYKTKEFSVVEFIKNNFPDLSWIFDKKINNGCSKRRPDILLDLGYQVVIIEIDENQHIDYDCSCENKRIMELSKDLDFRPVIFIRFNPDDYIKNNEKITSCWTINKNGICIVKKTKEKEWNNRLLELKNQVEYWTNTNNYTNKIIEIVELFYNN